MDWRMLFVVGGSVPLLLLPLIGKWLPETRPAHDPAANHRLAPTLFAEGRAAPTLLLWAVFMLTLVVLYLALNWLPTLVIAKGHTPADGFAAAMAFNVAGAVGSLVFGALSDRIGWRWPLSIAYLALAGVMAGMAASQTTTAILALSFAAGFLVMGAQFSLYAVTPSLYPPRSRGAGTGMAVAVGRLGSIAGPLIAGNLRNAGASPGEVFGSMAPVALAAGVGLIALAMLARPPPEP